MSARAIGTAARGWLAGALLLAASVGPGVAASRLLATATPPEASLQTARDRAASALTAGRAAEAEAEFRLVLEERPDDVPARLGLARALAAGGRPVDALREVRSVLEGDPGPSVLAVAGGLVAGLGRVDEALGLFARLRAKAPDDLAGYAAAALLLRDAERPEEAMALLAAAAERGIDDPRLDSQLALLHLANGAGAEAHRLAMASWRRGHETAELATVIGLAAADGGAPAGAAVEWLGRALAMGTEQAGTVRLALAGLLIDAERSEEALDHLRAAEASEAENPEWYYKRGLALRANGQIAAAERAFTRFQELNEGSFQAENAARELGTALNEAQSLATENRVVEAFERVERLRSDHPDFAPIRALRAKLLFSMRRPQEALDEIRIARDLEPGRTEYHYLEGVFAAQLGRWAEAEEAAGRALTLDRELDSARELLAEVRRRAAEGAE